jgi:ubiquinol-cytochrome c reductase cytochrome c subunit
MNVERCDRAGAGRRKRVAFLILFAVFMVPAALLVLGGAGSSGAETPPILLSVARTDIVSAGQFLYEDRCASCHGADGTGTYQGPNIIGLGPASYDFMMSTGRMPLAQPGAQAVRKEPTLTPAQIHAITAFLVSRAPGTGVPIPNVHPGAGSLSEGQSIYELNCAPCHGATGNGGAVGPQAAPSLKHATPTQIGEAVRIGPGTMPVFDDTVITDQQLNSLVRYVLYLRAPEDRGGLALNLGGPVVEGFVGIVIGLGAVIIVMRFIGERA